MAPIVMTYHKSFEVRYFVFVAHCATLCIFRASCRNSNNNM